MKDSISGIRARTAFIEPGSPWENGYVESFNGKLRDELLTAEVFNTLAEARVLIEQWRQHYNTVRPHSALGYRPPAPEVVIPGPPVPPANPGPASSTPPSTAMLHQNLARITSWGLVSMLHRYDPGGRLVGTVDLPVSQPTMCAFVGDGLDEMVVTSVTDKLTPEQLAREPLAGTVLRLGLASAASRALRGSIVLLQS